MALTAKKVYAILKRQISDMEAKIKTPIIYRGTVATADLLPLNPDIGDMYNIESKSVYGEAGMNVAWNGVVWDTMGAPINMSLYIKSSELADWVKQQNKPTYTAEEVGALPADTKIPSKTSDLQNDSGFLTKIPDNYLSGTDKTLSVSGKAADAKATGDKITELSADISNKLNKNQGSENSGKITGINESGDIVPMFPVSVDYNEETNCLEFGSDQKMELNKGINLDSTLTKTGYAADAGAVGEITNSLKEDISTKITKFYTSSQGETHLADSDNGKIQDMMLYGKSEQKQYSGKNLLNPTLQTTTKNGVTCTANGDGTYTLNGTATATGIFILHSNIDFTGQMRLCGGTSLVSLQYSNSSNFAYEDKGAGIIIEHFDSVTYPNASFNILIKPDNVYNNALIKPMFTTDLTATYDDFEPYTGGIPSPNPDYPQEIKSIVNPTVKVCGKNLLKATLQTATVNGVTCTNNGDGTYTLNGTASGGNPSFRIGKIIAKSGRKLVGSPGAAGSYVSYLPNGTWNNVTEEKGDGSIISNIGKGTDEIAIVVLNGTTVKNLLFKPMLTTDLTATYDDFEPYHEQTVTLPYTLNAIPVSSGGNVTINGQQYVSDYVDVERGKLVRSVFVIKFTGAEGWSYSNADDEKYKRFGLELAVKIKRYVGLSNYIINAGESIMNKENVFTFYGSWIDVRITRFTSLAEFKNFLSELNSSGKPLIVVCALVTPEEIDLTPEQIQAYKSLSTNYPVTNISINSEQLDGYTVFNYPISMENGWNYVKQQIGDTRDYIYDMDAKTQDIDTQAAEAYVNSEYAVALTELEV
jgi:hypothetical protein